MQTNIDREPKSKINNPIDSKPLIRIFELELINLITRKNITMETKQIKNVNNSSKNFFVSMLRPPKKDATPLKPLFRKKKLVAIPIRAIAKKIKLIGLLIER